MLDALFYNVKSFLRPVTQHRKLLERAKYTDTKILSPQEGNDLLACLVHRPAAIGKIGRSELVALRHYLRRADSSGHCESWGGHATLLYRNAGVYPPEPAIFSRFCKTFLETLARLDVLAVYFNWKENDVRRRFAPKATVTAPRALEPYYHDRAWSQRLAGKRVLVVSPFADSIRNQYLRRRDVWPTKPDLLPDFELQTL